MISFLVDCAFAAVLLVVCLRVMSLQRALVQSRANHQDYLAAFEKTAAALTAVRAALSDTNARGNELSTALAGLIKEARAAIGEMDARILTFDRERREAIKQASEPVDEEEVGVRLTAAPIPGTSHAAFAFCRRVARPMVTVFADS